MERPTAARFPLPVAWRDHDPTPLLDQYSVLVEQFIAVLPPCGSLVSTIGIIYYRLLCFGRIKNLGTNY